MDNRSRWRMDRQCSRVYDAMVRLDKFDPKLSQIYGLSEFDHLTPVSYTHLQLRRHLDNTLCKRYVFINVSVIQQTEMCIRDR